MKKGMFLVSSFVLSSLLYSAEQNTLDLNDFLNSQEVSAKFIEAWNFAQKSSEDANFLELAAKIKKIQSCSDCTMAEKRLFIILLNNRYTNLFKDYAEMNRIFVDNLKKYKGYMQICDSPGNVEECQMALTHSILRDMFQNAMKTNRVELIELLIDAGLNIQGDPASSSPLIQAINGNHKEIVQLLIDKGAKVNFKAYGGNTALKTAEQKGYKEIVEMLKKAGAR